MSGNYFDKYFFNTPSFLEGLIPEYDSGKNYPFYNVGLVNESGAESGVGKKDSLVIEVALAGFKREEITVKLEQDVLIIAAEHKETETGISYQTNKLSGRKAQRHFKLHPKYLNGGKISAKYTDGILRVVIPEKEEYSVDVEIA